jgi:hypothetical protein
MTKLFFHPADGLSHSEVECIQCNSFIQLGCFEGYILNDLNLVKVYLLKTLDEIEIGKNSKGIRLVKSFSKHKPFKKP